MLKRRYRSTEDNHKLRNLTYFNHPFEPDNEIKLIDDVDLPNSLSLESLSTVFVAKENDIQQTSKDSGAVERPVKNKEDKSLVKKKDKELFEDFDFEKAMNY